MLDTHSAVSVLTVYMYLHSQSAQLRKCYQLLCDFLRKDISVLFCLNVLVTQDTSILSEVYVEKSNKPLLLMLFFMI